jgi:hypothetical protein
MRGPYLAGQQSSAESLQCLLYPAFKLPYDMDMIRCALWEEGISSGELSLALGSPRGSTTALWRLNAIFTRVLHLLFSYHPAAHPIYKSRLEFADSFMRLELRYHITGGASGTSTFSVN